MEMDQDLKGLVNQIGDGSYRFDFCVEFVSVDLLYLS